MSGAAEHELTEVGIERLFDMQPGERDVVDGFLWRRLGNDGRGGFNYETVSCEWFKNCGQDATGYTSHGILGKVPTCDDHPTSAR